MSSLIFQTTKTEVLVATDTLATTVDGKPTFFTTKAFVIPHLRMIVCGTGLSGFLGRWFVNINDRILVKGIDNLDYHTPKTLAAMWQDYRVEASLPPHQSTTVYHFGFSEEDGLVHSYAYRSLKNFTSEEIGYGSGIKPPVALSEPIENERLFANIRRMMDEQRRIESSRPPGDGRIFIGGEIQVIHLTKERAVIMTVDRFDDFGTDQQFMFSNYQSG